jgi:O-antigen/teichoic acid export membrane protein
MSVNIKEIKRGALISYILIFVNTIYGIAFTPFLLSKLGMSEYGVYRIIASFTSSITVLDLGIGTTALRYASKFHAEKNTKKLNNFFAMSLIEVSIISLLMVFVSIGLYFSLDTIYRDSLTSVELTKAKQLFLLFIVVLVFNTFEKVLNSVIAACEHFAFANSLKLMRILGKVILGFLIISYVADSLILLFIEIFLLILSLGMQLAYIYAKLNLKVKLHKWDNGLFKESFGYTILMFVQSLVGQLNSNLDNMVIGAVINAATVSIYSIGLQLYAMFEQFAIAFSDLMLPTISKQVVEGASNFELENTVIKIDRLEFMALAAALCGFTLIGRDFLYLWLGPGYEMAWLVAIILMFPTMIPLVQNVCLSILRAKNKMMFRTGAICCMAVFNLIVTIFGVQRYGAIAACIGTALGLVGANIIAMNIYYVKVLKLNVFRIFKNVFSRTWVCCLMASLSLVVVNKLDLELSWGTWLLKVAIFIVVYGVMLYFFGMNSSEKRLLKSKL